MRTLAVLLFAALAVILIASTSAAIQTVHHTPECKPGDFKTDDCNRCRCVHWGKWACTRMRCIHKRDFPIPSDVQSVPCPPYDTFMLECNKCTCNFQGTGYQCTQQTCPSTRL